MTRAGTARLLALSMLRGVGPATLRKVLRSTDIETTSVDEWSLAVPALRKAMSAPDAWRDASERAREQIERAEQFGARILCPLDEEYPSLLAASPDDPLLLFVKGVLTPTPEQSVGIIGTREPTGHGLIVTDRITRFFVERGWSVVSGLALGCDAQAHRSAIDAGGHTVAVLAHGLHTVAPSRHRDLAQEIVEASGALVTQYPFGRAAVPRQFAQRDKTQAGLARGIVMVQSDLEGGSLIASRAALGQGRWLAVPFPTRAVLAADASSIRANRVLTEGANGARARLLKLEDGDALSRIIVLRDKGDYGRCLDSSAAVGPAPRRAGQASLL